MTQRTLHRTTALGIALFITAAAFGQGLVWESTTSGGPLGDKVITAHMYYMPKMLKTVSSEGDNTIIFRMDKELMYQIDPKEKTYSEMTFAEMEQQVKKMGNKYDAKMEELRKQMETMPPDQRKMVEQMMGGKTPGKGADAKIDVNKTGESRTISGYKSTKYVVTQNGKETMALWATKELKGFDAMRKDLETFSKRMMSLNPMMGKGIAEALQKVDGFPLETDMSGVKNIVTKVDRQNTPIAEFDVPNGYTKVKPKMMQEEEQEEKD